MPRNPVRFAGIFIFTAASSIRSVKAVVSIESMNGSLIFQSGTVNISNGTPYEIDCTQVPSGNYTVVIATSDGNVTSQNIVKL